MAQVRFHNYRRPLDSFAENLRMAGVVAPGRICGFDSMAIVAGNTLRISHTTSGLVATNLDGSAHAAYGVMQSRQGNLIFEDAPIDINVDFNATGNDRIDILILEHTFLDSPGGAAATYSIIKGVLTGAQEPALSAPTLQVLIGKFLIPAGAGDHTTTIFESVEPKLVGGASALVTNGEQVKSIASLINPGRVIVGAQVLSDFNRLTKSGLFRIATSLNRPTTATSEWFVIVMRFGAVVTQLTQAATTGKTYSRTSSDTGATWSAWQTLNSADAVALVGDLNYTSNHYITDGDVVTNALSELDAALFSLISAINALVGDLNYTSNHYITDLETVTSALSTLDNAIFVVQTAVGLSAPAARNLTAGNGLSGGGDLSADRTFTVNVDGATIEIAADTLRVKDLGITGAKIAAGTIDNTKVDASIATMPHAIADFNSLVKGSINCLTGAQANSPVAGGGNTFLTITTEDGITNGNASQTAIQVVGASVGTIYQRHFTFAGTVWSAWAVINNP